MTRIEPVHPGEVLKHDFMEPFALSSNALARAIGVTPARINEIVAAGAASRRRPLCGSPGISGPTRRAG